VLDVATRLVDKSMLQVERDGREPRYRMLATLRQFAQEKLAASDEAAWRSSSATTRGRVTSCGKRSTSP
jgi:predicted ATPase